MLVNLGTNAKSIHAGGKAARSLDSGAAACDAKAARFRLQRTAQSILFRKDLAPLQQHRTCWCHRSMRGESATLYRAADGSNAYLSGLNTCGNGWTCPVCGAKIAEHRRRELSEGMAAWTNAENGTAYLITLTFPHAAGDDLAAMLERFGKARQSWKNSRTYKRILGPDGTAGAAGAVTAMEVTHGANGWHPHVHMLVFAGRGGLAEGEPAVNGDLSSPAIDELRGAWVKCLLKVGLAEQAQVSDVWAHSFNVRGGEKAAEYIAKYGRDSRWGASSELTRAASKVGAAGTVAGELHVTPFQLLEWAGNGDTRAGALFREYAEAFHGKRLLTWSPGLRKRLKLSAEEAPDDAVADLDEDLPERERVGHIGVEDLQVIVSRGLLGELIRTFGPYGRANDQESLDDWMAWARTMPKTGRGAVLVPRTFTAGRDMVEAA